MRFGASLALAAALCSAPALAASGGGGPTPPPVLPLTYGGFYTLDQTSTLGNLRFSKGTSFSQGARTTGDQTIEDPYYRFNLAEAGLDAQIGALDVTSSTAFAWGRHEFDNRQADGALPAMIGGGAYAGWNDAFSIVPGDAGTSGLVTLAFVFNPTVNVISAFPGSSGTTTAYFNINLSSAGSSLGDLALSRTSSWTNDPFGFPTGSSVRSFTNGPVSLKGGFGLAVTVPFVAGQAIAISAEAGCMTAVLAAGSIASGRARCSLAGPNYGAYWGGIVNVTDASGTALAGYSAQTGSGYDYRAADARGLAASVPEARIWATMVIGFGMIGATLRRRPRVLLAA